MKMREHHSIRNFVLINCVVAVLCVGPFIFSHYLLMLNLPKFIRIGLERVNLPSLYYKPVDSKPIDIQSGNTETLSFTPQYYGLYMLALAIDQPPWDKGYFPSEGATFRITYKINGTNEQTRILNAVSSYMMSLLPINIKYGVTLDYINVDDAIKTNDKIDISFQVMNVDQTVWGKYQTGTVFVAKIGDSF